MNNLTQSTLFASNANAKPTWAHALRTEADGERQDIQARPELVELRSLSHEGRVRWQRNVCLPLGKKPRNPRVLRPEHEEQLLYVALYRDKIADHQAEIEAQKDSGKVRGGRRQIRAAGLAIAEKSDVLPSPRDIGVMLPEVSSHEQSIVDAYGADSSASLNTAISGPERGATFWQTLAEASGGSLIGNGPSIAAQRSASSRRGRTAELSATSGTRTAANIASVPSNPGVGGVANEYLETKRLGKLFDEWKKKLEEENRKDEMAHARSRRASVRFAEEVPPSRQQNSSHAAEQSIARHGRLAAPPSLSPPSTASPKEGTTAPNAVGTTSGKETTSTSVSAKKAGVASRRGRGRGLAEANSTNVVSPTGSPQSKVSRKPEGSARRPPNLDMDTTGSAQVPGTARSSTEHDTDFGDGSGSDASEHHGVQINESRLVSRLFQVITNPKVTGQAASESENSRKVPAHIEGFPTMNLMRLYRGPWRLDV